MEKLILNQRKIKKDIVELINNSNLPAFILKPIIKELYEQIELLEQQQYEKALEIDKKEKTDDKEEK